MTDSTTSPGTTTGSRFLSEAGAWLAIIAVAWGSDLAARLGEFERAATGEDLFRLVSEQVSSGIAAWIMVLFVAHWLRLFPLRRDAWVPAIVGHTAGTVIFAFGHYLLIVAFRAAWYAMNDLTYIWREPFAQNLFVEYQKDIKIYLGMLAVISAYRHYRPDTPASGAEPSSRLAVQTGKGESVIRVDDIDCLEASRNYVTVHVGDDEYIVRDTLTNLLARLGDAAFSRTHRSYAVNIDRVRELRSGDSGHRVILHNGRVVPLSRSYREAFRAALSVDR